ncbi:TatD family hydrolase [Candidatus Woesearchaeota archaeon]|nr:TatD family hydrolase [Candidatus Woesearchaeota archaeon]
MLLDIHCHLDHPDFEKDLDKVLQRAKDMIVVTCGISPRSNRFALDLAKKHKNVKAALGIYPPDQLKAELEQFDVDWNIETFDVDEEMKWIEEQLQDPEVVAISEIALDYSLGEKTNKESQKELFQKFLDLAKRTDKPIIVHSRKAELDVIEMIEKSGLKKVVMHCFCGKKSLVKRCQENGWYFSIPTNVVRAQNFQQIVESTDINKLLTETDAPYLSPFRDKRNEPSFVTETIKKIAEIKGMVPEEVEQVIHKNYLDLI